MHLEYIQKKLIIHEHSRFEFGIYVIFDSHTINNKQCPNQHILLL